ncbi:bifunctional hydroxymethylpyrimidine kinase/phosphomethylpyrimidine kinase [Bombilactobacillus thymidiniphilus]|uniref:Hydroxymethylpyrimidine/phosphomethylpyrimidine kinase n=1 Tax=Bombilactobacillus thymidiniphilus TaxID=2923363 RepID=A0ABY4PB55_9LACO|nr:bifunctional hydroxymethylpyrimidine kinase/phosphomethylpyrimidine kinase [Bombilactobacillus thymidiniphilus]UQS82993.1 bifunctional hydroxymethylpyrimidine kinase/phosphomethylpyrimidine kinase [Bombilactobacillus thymidiniphilus]
MINSFPQVVTIAGSDCDGSAGAQADLKTFQEQQVYGMSILTAAVAGNSYGIFDSVTMTPEFITAQFKTLADDFSIQAFKTGMLSDQATIECVATNIRKYQWSNFVLDPVIITKHQALLLEEAAYQSLIKELVPLATLITPNFYEAQKLTGLHLADKAEIQLAAQKLQQLGAKNVLIKGKHDDNRQEIVEDYVLLADGQEMWLAGNFVATDHTNGTGDTLSACITAQLALGHNMRTSIQIAKLYTQQAIQHQIAVGHQFGPINHGEAPK